MLSHWALVWLCFAGGVGLTSALPVTTVEADADEITVFPGLMDAPAFRQYSGFLKASDTKFLHYWFVESQGNPSKDPLIFWYNGGPGCSSISNKLKDNGPYAVDADGTYLHANPTTWNQFASVVYIDAPAGVGYSYATDGNIAVDDNQVAAENYNALKEFFTRFPVYRHRRVYLTGQSYAGIYVPTLASAVIDGLADFHINLQGVIIGNGFVSKSLDFDTLFEFAYTHGLVGEELYAEVRDDCCSGNMATCHLVSVSRQCLLKLTQYFVKLARIVNPYDIYGNCDWSGLSSNGSSHSLIPSASPLYTDGHPKLFGGRRKDAQPGITRMCYDDSNVINYMNREDVREALHIPANATAWNSCSNQVRSGYRSVVEDVSAQMSKILDAKLRVLLYNGDTDMICNVLLGQQFSDRFGLTVIAEKVPWYQTGSDQLAGFKTVYYGDHKNNQLIFLTVRGAGHMASQMRPTEVNYAVRHFVANKRI